MKTRHAFDRVFDTQIVFRRLLQAMANPGTAEDIGGPASRLDGDETAMMAIAATLLDNEVRFATVGGDSDTLRDFTGSHPAPPEQADYLFIYDELHETAIESLFRTVKPGSMEGPDGSCTLVVKLPPADGGGVDIAGPGVPGLRHAPVGHYGHRFMALRQAAGHLYPCGVDLIFVGGDNSLVCLPRLCRPKEVD